MFDLSENLLQIINSPELIKNPLYTGKLPLEAQKLCGPVVRDGEFTWQPVDTSKLPVLCPLSGRASAIVFRDSTMCFAASVLPDINNNVFASSDKVCKTLSQHYQSNNDVYVLLADKPDSKVSKAISVILSRLQIKPNQLKALQAEHSPANHPIVKDGELYTVDARVVTSMSTNQHREHPLWAPIQIEP